MEKGIILKTEKTEGFIFKEEPIDNTEQDENDGEPIQKKRKIQNQMTDYQNTIPTLELVQAMFVKFIFEFKIWRGSTLDCIIWSMVDTHKSATFGSEFDHIRLQHFYIILHVKYCSLM